MSFSPIKNSTKDKSQKLEFQDSNFFSKVDLNEQQECFDNVKDLKNLFLFVKASFNLITICQQEESTKTLRSDPKKTYSNLSHHYLDYGLNQFPKETDDLSPIN